MYTISKLKRVMRKTGFDPDTTEGKTGFASKIGVTVSSINRWLSGGEMGVISEHKVNVYEGQFDAAANAREVRANGRDNEPVITTEYETVMISSVDMSFIQPTRIRAKGNRISFRNDSGEVNLVLISLDELEFTPEENEE